MKTEVQDLRNKLSAIQQEMQRLFNDCEKIRRYYKYQNSDTDSTSESAIITFNTVIGDTYSVLCDLDELIQIENDSECECNDDE